MNKKFMFALLTMTLVGSAAIAADNLTKIVCTTVYSPTFQEELFISGSGLTAKVHIEDATLSGDFTYDAKSSEVFGNIPGAAINAVSISGEAHEKSANPPAVVHAFFIIQSDVLNGTAGILQRFGGEGFIDFSCKPTDLKSVGLFDQHFSEHVFELDHSIISPDQLRNYKIAAINALAQMTVTNCTDSGGGYVNHSNWIDKARQVESNLLAAYAGTIDSSGMQPALTLMIRWPQSDDFPDSAIPPIDPTTQIAVKITSSADYKSVVGLELDFQQSTDVNSGSLFKPVISKGFVTTHSLLCH